MFSDRFIDVWPEAFVNKRCFVSMIMFFACYGGVAEAMVINLDLYPSSLVHTRQYEPLGSTTFFAETLSCATPVGVINPGDPVDVHLNFHQPIRLENFYKGESFSLGLSLIRGTSVSGWNQDLTSDFALGAIGGLTLGTDHSGGWLSAVEGGAVQQEFGTSLTPVEAFGQFGSLNWEYVAPNWTPVGTQVRFEFDLSIQKRALSPEILSNPEHDLITFVPEPSVYVLLTSVVSGIVACLLTRCVWRANKGG